MIIDVIDSNGKIVTTTKTAFDGFYVVSQLPYGTYFVRPTADEVKDLSLDNFVPIKVELSSDNSIVYGNDFIVDIIPKIKKPVSLLYSD